MPQGTETDFSVRGIGRAPLLRYDERVKKILIAIVAVCVLTFAWYRWQLRPVDARNSTPIAVSIPQGTSVKGIARMLADKGVIRSAWAFGWYAKLHHASLQAGDFSVPPSLGAKAVIQQLGHAQSDQVTVTVPEGFTVSDIDALIAEKGLAPAGAIRDCARTCDFSAYAFLPSAAGLADRGGKVEGYLYPDTYFVERRSFDAKAFLDRLLQTFDDRVIKAMPDLQSGAHPLHEVITMASLLEEESRKGAERPVVAGILWNRIDQGMSLGVDAAVRYIVEKPKSALNSADLQIDSPYNLRQSRGLPPGPIASPSLSSIEAALHPAETPYLYYLHDASGQIHYAQTNDEHNANRARYLQ
jgi:UPF0755 protein